MDLVDDPYRLRAVVGTTNDIDCGDAGQEPGEALTDLVGVVDDECAYRAGAGQGGATEGGRARESHAITLRTLVSGASFK